MNLILRCINMLLRRKIRDKLSLSAGGLIPVTKVLA